MKAKSTRGLLAERKTRASGHTLIYVANKMGISRTTLYNRFKQDDLTDLFLFKLGKVINYDFSKDFPEIRRSDVFQSAEENKGTYQHRASKELTEIQIKYYRILEDYNKLLKFLVRIANDNELYTLKKEIDSFVSHYIE